MVRWIRDRFSKAGFRRLGDDSAAMAPLMALMIIPIAGATAMAVELGQWFYVQRAMQNAADSAAIAAATNNSTVGSTYITEARAAARQFGYIDGQGTVTVNASQVACPAGVPAGGTCYRADLTRQIPVVFSRLVGFTGNANGGMAQTIAAGAVATTAGGTTKQACIWTLGTGNSFQSNGGPKPDLAGCNVVSNGNSTCNGHNLGADFGIAVGTNNGCGVNSISGATAPVDTYAPLASNIPANSCSSYPSLNDANKRADAIALLPAENKWSGSMNVTAPRCGDVVLTGDVTLTGDNTVTIFNGTLDLNGHTIRTASGASATVIFSGDNAASSTRAPTGSGTLDIQAPSSGTWSGVAMYQDPRMSPPSSALDVDYTGNEPAWSITGLIYLPKSNVEFSGIVNKSANGTSCFVLVAYTILVNGTGTIFANNTECAAAGLTPPGVGTTTREKLVL